MPPRRSKAKHKATHAEPVEETVEVYVYAEDSMPEDEADGEDSKEESSESGAEETDGEESKKEATAEKMDAGHEEEADETKAEDMDCEPEANGADAEKTKLEAADAKVEAAEQAAAAADGGSGEEAAEAGGEIGEDGADSDAQGEGTDAVEESPPPSPPARNIRRREATPDPVPEDDEEEETPLPPRRRWRRRRKSGECGDSPPPVPDNLRCRRSDGKKWRCTDPALPTVSFCEYHYAKACMGKKPPADGELLAVALQRLKYAKACMGKKPPADGELLAVALQRLKNKRKGKRRLNMTPESPRDPSCAMSKAKEAQMSCHRCGLKKVARVVKCKNCQNNCFCNRCINKWYSGIARKDMKMKCPVCRGSCDCKRCTLGQTKGAMHKESPSDLGRRRLNLTPESPKATKDLPNGFMTISPGSSGAVCSPVMTKVGVDWVQANEYSIKRCISALTATALAPDEKIKASEVFQILANRETFLSFNETDPEIALLWLRGKVDKL